MRALEFINALNQSLFEIKENPESHILYVENDYKLFKETKKFIYTYFNNNPLKINNRRIEQFLIDFLNRDNFKNKIKYLVIKLNEFGIENDKFFLFISKSIEVFINGESVSTKKLYSNSNDDLNLNELIINELSNCFREWYYPRDIFYIEFLEKRQLIFKNNKKRSWYVSNLGNYLMRLPTFESVIFLLSIEVAFYNDKEYSKFINIKTIEKLLDTSNKNEKYKFYGEPYILRLLGVIENKPSSFSNKLTTFGEKILINIKNNYKSYNQLILLLLESESTGVNFQQLSMDSKELDNWFDRSYILADTQRISIRKSLELYKEGFYLESLNLLYPQIEGMLNNALEKMKIPHNSLKGMQNKVEKLKKEKKISSRASTGIEIFSSRNKILHGNLIEEDSETLKPLFILVFTYFKKIATEIEYNFKEKA